MGWIIFAVIAVLIAGLFLAAVRIIVIYNKEDGFILSLRFLFLKMRIYPPNKEKAKKIKKTKKTKKTKKAEKKVTKETQEKHDFETITDLLNFVAEAVKVVTVKLMKYLRIEITEIYIKAGEDDAASTAILYGVVCQMLAYILEILSNVTNTRRKRKAEIKVEADYLHKGFEARIKIAFRVRLWQMIMIALSGAKAILIGTKRTNKKQTEENKNGRQQA